MAFYRKVWDDQDTMFEVNPEKAADLVLNHGWSNTDPALRKTKAKKPAAKTRPEAPVADTSEVFHSAGANPTEATRE
jgi:hypothetical protein